MDWSCQVVVLMAKTWVLNSLLPNFLLSSVNSRVASEIQGFFFDLWIPRTSSAAFLMIVVVCSNRESAMGSLVSTCTSSSSNWDLFCSSSWKSFAMLGSSSLVMFHFFPLDPSSQLWTSLWSLPGLESGQTQCLRSEMFWCYLLQISTYL